MKRGLLTEADILRSLRMFKLLKARKRSVFFLIVPKVVTHKGEK